MKTIRLLALCLLITGIALAQDKKDDGQIHVSLKIKQDDGTEKVLDKTYSSVEEMRKDEELKAFRESNALYLHENIEVDMERVREEVARSMKEQEQVLMEFHKEFNTDSIRQHVEEVLKSMDFDKMMEEMKMSLKIDSLEFLVDLDKQMEELEHMEKAFKELHSDGDVRIFVAHSNVKIKDLSEVDKKNTTIDFDDKALELESLTYYPNPNDGRFDVKLTTKEQGPVTLQVHSLKGDLLYDFKISTPDRSIRFPVDISEQEPGIYVLQIKQNGKSLSKKIVIE